MNPLNSFNIDFSNNIEVLRECNHSWTINDITVNLFQLENSIEYKTVFDNELMFEGSVELSGKTPSDMIDYLKKCQVIIGEKGAVSFHHKYHTWNLENQDISLIRGTNNLIWDVFYKTTNTNEFYPFENCTIPSFQCNKNTIEIIEKIKNKAFDDREDLICLLDDFNVMRTLDKKTLKKEIENLKDSYKDLEFDKYIQVNDNLTNLAYGGSFFSSTMYGVYSSTIISSISTATSSFFGGGFLGSLSGGYIGLCLSGTVALIPTVAIWQGYNYWCYSKDNDKRNDLANRIKLKHPQEPLLIEIEPISAPSKIDGRVLVSKFNWAVTLITGPQGDSEAHTSIIVEGLANEHFSGHLFEKRQLEDGNYFMHKSEFNPPVKSYLACLKIFNDHVIAGIQRSKIWMIPAEKVIEMLKDIEKDMDFQQAQLKKGIKVRLNQRGIDAMPIPGFKPIFHSCFTWARDKLKIIDIDLGTSCIKWIGTLPTNFTEEFNKYKDKPIIKI